METVSDPVWKVRSKKLQGWLRENGPRTTDGLYKEYGLRHMISETLMANILAYAEDICVQHIGDKWYAMPVSSEDLSKEALRNQPARSPEGCQGKSEFAEGDDLEPEPDIPAWIEHPPG